MNSAWALLVVSSEAQAETLQYQRAWAELVCSEKSWHLSRTVEGVASGKNGPRRLSQDVLLDVRATPVEARPQFLLMTRLDRVGRGSIVDSQIFVRDLFILGVRVFTRDQGEMKLDSAMDELIAAVQMAVARHENDVRRDKMRAVYRRRLNAGQVISNRAPYGLEINADRKLVVRPDYHATLKEVFRQRVIGIRVTDIARWLQVHAPPQTYKNSRSYFVHWTDSRVACLVMNRAYSGVAVDETTWLRAQRTSQYAGKHGRQTRKYGVFPLGVVIRCVCGRALSADARNAAKLAKWGRGPNRYYGCRAIWNHRLRGAYHRADDVEARFVELLRDLAVRPSEGYKWNLHGMTEKRLGREIARIRVGIDRVDSSRSRVWRLEELGRLSDDETASRIEDLRQKRWRLDLQLLKLVEERTLLEAAKLKADDVEALHRDASARYEAGDDRERAAIARAVVVSLGGLRVTLSGHLITGTGPDLTAQRRVRRED